MKNKFVKLHITSKIDKTVMGEIFTMIKGRYTKSEIDHDFFRNKRWWSLLKFTRAGCRKSSFPDKVGGNLIFNGDELFLTMTVIVDNFDNIIDLFIDWIVPYLQTNGYIGYYIEEGMNEPIILYKSNNGLFYKDLTGIKKKKFFGEGRIQFEQIGSNKSI